MTVALVAASVVVAGCGADQDQPPTAGSTPTTATPAQPATPSTTAAGPADSPAATLAELARQPCRALDQQESGKLGIIIEGSETDLDGKSCQWEPRPGWWPSPRTRRSTRRRPRSSST